VSPAYGVYFSTVPVPYDDGRPDATSTNRRICQAWSLLQFIPGRAGEVAFVQVAACTNSGDVIKAIVCIVRNGRIGMLVH
jgi:hypothetical protein